MASTLQSLPAELLTLACRGLDPVSLARFEAACRIDADAYALWRKHCADLWRGKQDFDGRSSPLAGDDGSALSWRQSYARSLADGRRDVISVAELVGSPWIVRFGRFGAAARFPPVEEELRDGLQAALYNTGSTLAEFALSRAGVARYYDGFYTEPEPPGEWRMLAPRRAPMRLRGGAPRAMALEPSARAWLVQLEDHAPLRVVRRADWGWRLINGEVMKDSLPRSFVASPLWAAWLRFKTGAVQFDDWYAGSDSEADEDEGHEGGALG